MTYILIFMIFDYLVIVIDVTTDYNITYREY